MTALKRRQCQGVCGRILPVFQVRTHNNLMCEVCLGTSTKYEFCGNYQDGTCENLRLTGHPGVVVRVTGGKACKACCQVERYTKATTWQLQPDSDTE